MESLVILTHQIHHSLCRTGIKCGTRDSTQPWRAPGTAKVFSPCGGFCLVGDSDTPNGCDPNDLSKYSTKHDGRNLPKNDRAQWQAGGTARVGFTALFNHGGGYAYRLCSAGDEQTEECFQKTHLNFASENSTVVPSRRSKGKGGEYAAVTMTTGTHPEGSQWRTIRIPSCSTTTPSICGHELLPKPCPTCCAHNCDRWHFSLMDTVEVPATLAAGDYTLSWRWDAEINHQVWQGCSDITIVKA